MKTLTEYDCLKCHLTHYSNEEVYDEHIKFQSGLGIMPHEHRWTKTGASGKDCACGAYQVNVV